MLELSDFVADFARGIVDADHRSPQAIGARNGRLYSVGIGPHNEDETVRLVMVELKQDIPKRYSGHETAVPYPGDGRTKVDLCLRPNEQGFEWAVELKLLRMLGDNGKANDNMLMHILSPYRSHRSAVTDCEKVLDFSRARRKAIMIFGYESDEFPLLTAIDAFENVATQKVTLGTRQASEFQGLIHPVHRSGAVFGWEVLGTRR